jgi:hypothetical protein
LLLVVSQILPGSFAQEEMPLHTNFKPVWDSDVTEKLSYPMSVTNGFKTSSWIQSSGRDPSSKRIPLHVFSTSCFLSATVQIQAYLSGDDHG